MDRNRRLVCLLVLMSFCMTALVKSDCSDTSKSGNCTTGPKKISVWYKMKAQSGNQGNDVNFVTEMEESCNELPLKVEVQTKLQTGSEFIFPGSGITQGSDYSYSPYGGVVYMYKYTPDGTIQFIVPKNKSGVAVFSGGSAWDGVTQINETSVDVRYRVWCRCNLPTPAFESNWTDINVVDKKYLEISHGLGITPDMVIVQLRHGSTNWVSDIMGAMSTSETGRKKSGVIYGYNSRTVRIWAPNNGSLFHFTEGWESSHDKYMVLSGQVKVYVWTYLMNIKSKSIPLNRRPSGSDLEFRLPVSFDISQDMLHFTISPTDGENGGFYFSGMGSVQNADPTNQYGGVMYSYSTDKIRLWHPNLDGRHFLVYVNSKWGGGNHIQSSESVVAKVSVWKAGQICLIPKSKRTTPNPTTTQSTTAMTSRKRGQLTSLNPSTGTGNPSYQYTKKNESWYERSVAVPVLWLVVGGGCLLLFILISAAVTCLCKRNSDKIIPLNDEET
ncbi:uncharacterized protein LOC125676240 [Ostrea edulis]|uniref:uncharacterized protein LOC125676240 n=1 Tax=Ostrea edulis TaxID=37623 RepID=UPI00209493C5|nr:uncharacterized protein LOC125676240 [Ostrea edulis]